MTWLMLTTLAITHLNNPKNTLLFLFIPSRFQMCAHIPTYSLCVCSRVQNGNNNNNNNTVIIVVIIWSTLSAKKPYILASKKNSNCRRLKILQVDKKHINKKLGNFEKMWMHTLQLAHFKRLHFPSLCLSSVFIFQLHGKQPFSNKWTTCWGTFSCDTMKSCDMPHHAMYFGREKIGIKKEKQVPSLLFLSCVF